MVNVSINDNIYKIISKMAEKNNTTETEFINGLLEEKIIEEEYDCDAFEKDLKEARARIKEGKGIEMTAEELKKHIGVDSI